MKISFLIQDISTQGGTERTTCCLASEMARHGHCVQIFSLFRNEDEMKYPLDDSVRVIYLTEQSYNLSLNVLQRFCKLLMIIPKVRTALRDADIVISQKFAASVVAFLSRYRKKTYACEHFRYAMYHPSIRFVRDRIYRLFHMIVVLTPNDKQRFIQTGVKRIACIPNMISVNPKPYQGESNKRIISVGRLTMQKGYDMLLEAVALIKDKMQGFHIDIFGEGELQEKLMSQCHKLQLEKVVQFCPFTKQIEDEYAHSAFYVMSSRFEGFPMVLVEAAACGLPIVSFDCPEGPKILLKEGGGILVDAGNIQGLADAILHMIQDDAYRLQCHNESQRIVIPYQPENIYQQWMDIFNA